MSVTDTSSVRSQRKSPPPTRALADRHRHGLRRLTGCCRRRGTAKSKATFAGLAARPFPPLFPLGLALRLLPSPGGLQFLTQLLVLPAQPIILLLRFAQLIAQDTDLCLPFLQLLS